MSTPTQGQPIDWTNGTGVFSGSGAQSITIPANTNRKWIKIQNQDVGLVTVAYASVEATDGVTPSTPVIVLAAASASGGAGGTEERTLYSYVPLGAITVTGTGGQKVAILTGGG